MTLSTTCILLALLQVIINLSWITHIEDETPIRFNLYHRIVTLERELQELRRQQQQQQQQMHASIQSKSSIMEIVDSNVFFPFTIRDSRRLVPNQIPLGFHIFDYVDVHNRHQEHTKTSNLFQDGIRLVEHPPPCQAYTLSCYKKKIIQVLDIVLNATAANFFFYMEADNDLCVPLSYIQHLAETEHRYFIAAGTGFSGWIMSRSFVLDFLDEYRKEPATKSNFYLQPDSVASSMMIPRRNWAVTRRYLVSHTIISTSGAQPLTMKNTSRLEKHLPRCLEPHRGKWPDPVKSPTIDYYGWDYFDYDLCGHADLFPCDGPEQIHLDDGNWTMMMLVMDNWTTLKDWTAIRNATTVSKDGMTTIHFRRTYNATNTIKTVNKKMSAHTTHGNTRKRQGGGNKK